LSKKTALIIGLLVVVTTSLIGVANASLVCASSNWDAWIKSYQPNVKYNSYLANGSASHTVRMSNSGNLYHDPGLSLPPGGTKVGEIVGYGPSNSPQTIQQAFLNSPSHYSILVTKGWTHYGYSVIIDDNGRMWVTIRFATIQTAPAAKPKPAISSAAPKASAKTVAQKPQKTTRPSATPSSKPRPVATPTPSPTLTEETNEKTTYRTVPRIDEQPVYTGPIYGSC